MNISPEHYRKMRAAYRPDVANFIASAARERRRITYSDLQEKYGIITRAWGDILGGIAIRCHEAGLPLLPVIVVLKGTDRPSPGAVLYVDLGMKSTEDITFEQSRCFDFDWSPAILPKG